MRAGDRAGPQVAEYLPGRKIDVYAPPGGGPAVLLWHGRGPDERDVLRPLAQLAAGLGLVVFVPDWRSDVPDGGRAELLASLEFARSEAAGYGPADGRFVLAGWSRGGKAAAALALAPGCTGGWQPSSVVCLASGFVSPDPITGAGPLTLAQTAAAPPPVYLVHGTADRVVDVGQARQFAAALAGRGHRVQLRECPTDHAGVIGTEYDPGRARCRPATASHAVESGRLSARTLRDAAACDAPGVLRRA